MLSSFSENIYFCIYCRLVSVMWIFMHNFYGKTSDMSHVCCSAVTLSASLLLSCLLCWCFGPVLCFGFKYRTQRVPELIPKPTVAQLLDETTTRRVYIYGIQDDNGTDVQNFSLDLTPPPDVIMKTSPGTSEGMNVLGIVIFSATMGEWLAWTPHTHALTQHTSTVQMHKYMW